MHRYDGQIAIAVLSCALALASCDSADPTVDADLVVIDRRIQALTSAQIGFVDGTYTNCTNRTGSWSVRVSGAAPMTNQPLTLFQGESYATCKLAITDIFVGGGTGLLTGSMPITLDTTYGTARSFGMGSSLFYANAALGSANFDGPVAITLLFSDDPALAVASTQATYAVAAASVTAMSVPAPDYTLDFSSAMVTTTLQKKVATISGNAVLTAGTSTGESYAIITGAVGATYADIKTAYDGASKTSLALMIPVSSLIAINDDLTSSPVRTIIVSHTVSGVSSFQKFAITFNPPP